MDKSIILQYKSSFDNIVRYIESDDAKEQVEEWFAHELQAILGYLRWENFLVAIRRAVDLCKAQRINIDDHFREVTKMVELGSGSIRLYAYPLCLLSHRPKRRPQERRNRLCPKLLCRTNTKSRINRRTTTPAVSLRNPR